MATRTCDSRTERPLRIAMVAPPWIPVPPPGYGGIEQVVALLCDALVDRGHDVELFCAPGSQSRARVRPLLPEPYPDDIQRAMYEADHSALAMEAIEDAAEPFDVIHDHSGFTLLALADRLDTPLVHTVHGPFGEESSGFYARHGSKASLVCLSQDQARSAPEGARIAAVVPNPIDAGAWRLPRTPGDHLLWLGRMVPDKGPHRAIRSARAAGRQLILAGVVQPGFEEFFASEVEPHVDGSQVRYVGEVGGEQKQRLLAEASAFLMPIDWPEPFGMVIVESLAAGCPVLAFPCGAAPEIVEHGCTGFLADDEEGLAALVARAGEIDPNACRRSAARYFPDGVAARYEAVYRSVSEEPALAQVPLSTT
jgi:glycosyltransferase involved in cell wall biosynthesis